jgi:hypothetical protein
MSTLFFICPTDFLETEIMKCFSSDNYFLTALGNNYHFDFRNVEQIQTLILAKNITQIVFVSDFRNNLFSNALNKVGSQIKTDALIELELLLQSLTWEQRTIFDFDTQLCFLAAKHLQSQMQNFNKSIKSFEHQHNSTLKIRAMLFDRKHSEFVSIDHFLIFETPHLN